MDNLLTNEQRSDLTLFQEITSITDQELAIQILASNNWNLEVAINEYSHHQDDIGALRRESVTSPPIVRQNNAATSLPNERDTSPNNVLHRSWYFLEWIFSVQRVAHNPDNDSRKLIATFELKYTTPPHFFDSGYQAAVRQAYQQSKFLLVYLHSEMHENTDQFCTDVLCAPNVSRYIESKFILWGGSVCDVEGFALMYQLKCKTFPFLCVLLCQSETLVQVADTIQGPITEHSLLEKFTIGEIAYGTMLRQITASTNRRSEDSILRQQQDREYAESIERDRQMRENAERERLRRQEDEQELEREAAKRAQEEELRKALDLTVSLNREKELSDLRARLGPEPEGEVAPGDISLVRFQLPKGAKVSRKFLRTDTIQTIHEYLEVYFYDNQTDVRTFSVSTNYPKRELSGERYLTLEEAGLHPRGMLFVQDLDA